MGIPGVSNSRGARDVAVIWAAAFAVIALWHPPVVRSAVFQCAAGEVSCLIAAINAANAAPDKDSIELGPGTYSLASPLDQANDPSGLPSITSPVVIRGTGGAEATVIQRDENAPALRIFRVTPSGVLSLEHLTVRGGFLSSGNGGGILNQGGTVHLTGSIVANNVAENVGGGGGIASMDGTLTIFGSRLSGNSAAFQGGGILLFGGSLTITDSVIIQNKVSITSGSGGGVFILSASLPGTAKIFGSVFRENEAVAGAGIGNTATLTIDRSTLGANRAVQGGGILNDGTLVITNSTIDHNQAAEAAGIWNDGKITLVNSTVGLNVATFDLGRGPNFNQPTGGGLINFAGVSASILNSTISGNSAAQGGGIVDAGAGQQNPMTLHNTIIAGNSAETFAADCFSANSLLPITSLGNNFVGDPQGCFFSSAQNTDLNGMARLGAFINDGRRPGGGHFPLLPGSPAIDNGNAAACPPTDQLGHLRVGVCDIGAIEFRAHRAGRRQMLEQEQESGRAEHGTPVWVARSSTGVQSATY